MFLQSGEPVAQQWRGFHLLRKDPSGWARMGDNVEVAHPLDHSAWGEGGDDVGDAVIRRSVARQEFIKVFGVRDVETAFAGHQEFPTEAGHGVVNVDAEALLGQNFGGHKPGWA